uniref:Uncharacterized protein n=1 Tax=Vitis vinifera TaxID=29760 RepID=F6HA16_VITVI
MAAGEGRHRRASMVRERGKEEEEMEKKRKREKGERLVMGRRNGEEKEGGKRERLVKRKEGFRANKSLP